MKRNTKTQGCSKKKKMQNLRDLQLKLKHINEVLEAYQDDLNSIEEAIDVLEKLGEEDE